VSRDRSYQSPIDSSDQDIARVQVDWERTMNDRFTLRNKTYYRSLDWQATGTLFNGTTPTPGGPFAFRTLTILDDDQELFGNQLEGVLELGSTVEHTILVGLEVSRLTDEFALDIVPPDTGFGGMPGILVLDPVETFAGIPFTVPLGRGDVSRDVLAPYVLDRMKLTDEFELLAGGRWDRIEYEDDVTTVERDDSDLSPILGVTWSPVRAFSLFANAGQSFSPQSPRVQGNPGPEEASQVELGARRSFADGRYRATLAVYDIEREDVPITDATGFLQEAGDQSSRGAELEIAAQPAERLRVLFAWAYNDSELDRFSQVVPGFGLVDLSGNEPPYAPAHLGNLWVSRSFESGLGVGGGARYVGEQYLAADNAYELDAAVVWSGFVSWELEAWRFGIHLENLTDEDWETGSYGSASVVPADPFSIEGKVEFRF
jgi:iron complex outermembrane receptor protein